METFQFASTIEIVTLGINLKQKLLIIGTYKPPNIKNDSFLNELYSEITFFNSFVLLGGLNIVRHNTTA